MQSEQIDQLATALAKAQGMMKSAAKSKENPFFKSHYADLPAVWDSCRDALSKNGLAVIQTLQFEGDNIWLETTLAHSGGQWMRSRYPVKPVKPDPQSLGSAQTYARRYALMAMVGVVAEDEDDDAEAAVGRAGNGKAAEPPKRPVAAKADDAAKTWATNAEAAIHACRSADELTAWEHQNQAAMQKLLAVDKALHKQVNAAAVAKYNELEGFMP